MTHGTSDLDVTSVQTKKGLEQYGSKHRNSKNAATHEDESPMTSSKSEVRFTLQGMDSSIHEGSLEEELHKRVGNLEKQNFRMKLVQVFLVMIVRYLGFEQNTASSSIIIQTLLKSRGLKLLGQDGNTRMFLRMFSRVPELQLLDSNGKPRMSLG